ncbi:MAG: GAF domain-containing protein [Magnetococcales bacterium]|nr:GAF domain-containing protein [Magnetococcales bacterium]
MESWQRYSGLMVFSLVMIVFLVLQGSVVIMEQRDNLEMIHDERMEENLNLIGTMAHESILKHDHATLERVLRRWAEKDEDIVTLIARAANDFELVRYHNPERGQSTRTYTHQVRQEDRLLLTLTVERNFSRAREDVFRLSVKLTALSIAVLAMLGVILRWVLWHTSVLPLQREVRRRKKAEDEAERLGNIHAALNDMLRITLLPLPLHEQLGLSLAKLLSIPWLAVEAKGAIFLADRDILRMVAQQGLSPDHQVRCGIIRFGECLCGRAALERKTISISHFNDERHEIRWPNMGDHGHYCVPILNDDTVLGVITLYLMAGHPVVKEERQFLRSVGSTLEGLILRQRDAEALRHLNEELEHRVESRTGELRASMEKLQDARDQLYQSEKMAALGRLVAGVSHEINTPVGIAFTASSFLDERGALVVEKQRENRMEPQAWSDFLQIVREASGLIQNNLMRAAQLIRSFKQVAVDQSVENMRTIQLGGYLHEIMHSLRPKIKPTRHRVEIRCPEDLMLFGDPGAFFQIIGNLVMNSLTHGFEGREEGRIFIDVTGQAGGEVEMIYRDDGKGIDANNEERIFEPFFTTRQGEGGSGLGMHIVYNLVTQTLKGSIVCHGHPGQGAEFVIRFPMTRECGQTTQAG